MLISHKNTGTIGDLATSFPVLSALSKIYGPINLTLPYCYYLQYNGFKEFMEYQDFINIVDFEDGIGDFDLQCRTIPVPNGGFPIQTYYVKHTIENHFGITLEIDNNFKLKVPHVDIPDTIKNKNIVVDRVKTNVIKDSGLFQNIDEYYWIVPTDYKSNGDTLIYNINVCLQTNKTLYVTPTGLPIILQHFDKKMEIIAFDNPGLLAWNFAYFQTNSNLKFTDYHKVS
jgi:hypothetical protein